jgi:hypothetical protein
VVNGGGKFVVNNEREKEKRAVSELERMCHETKVFRNGKEVFVSEELRQKLFGIINFLPLRKVIDRGYTLNDRKKLNPREAAAVSMLDKRILTDTEFQKEVKDLLLRRARLEENFPVGELERDKHAVYALFFLAHQWVTNYIPRKDKGSILDRADKGEIDLEEELYGRKRTPNQGDK